MNKTCSFGSHTILKSLQNFCGTDAAKYLEYFSRAFESNPTQEELEPKASFSAWYKDTYKTELNLKTIGSVSLKNAIVRYYDFIVPNYASTEVDTNSTKSAVFGYTSALARKKGIQYFTTLIYKDYLNIERGENELDRNILSEVASENVRFVRDYLAELISEDNPEIYNDVWNNLTSNCGSYLDTLIKEKEQSGEGYNNTVLNWMSLYRELTSTYKDNTQSNSRSAQEEVFDEIYNSKLITSLALSKYDTFADLEDANNMSLNSVESSDDNDTDEAGNEDKKDTTIRDHSLHLGQLDDFKKHLSERIERLLNTIPKLNSPVPKVDNSKEKAENEETALDLKIDSTIGFPEYFDSTEIATVLYSHAVKDDDKHLVNSIRTIAESSPEYAGLSILANQLESDRDLRYHFYTNFGKHIVSKAQTVLGDGNISYRISNPSANRLNSLKNQYINEFITNARNVNITDILDRFDAITNVTVRGRKDKPTSSISNRKVPKIIKDVEQEVGRTRKVENSIEKMYNIFKLFYPSLNKNSVINFVCNNPDLNIQEAIAFLYDDVKKIVDTASNVQQAIRAKENAIAKAKAHNDHLSYENRVRGAHHTADEYEDIDKIRQEDVIKPDMLVAPSAFAEHMLKHAIVKTNLNSVNVHGNQSSDVLNSSLLTRLKAIFENTDIGENSPLQLFAEDYHLDTNVQFKLSNILIEQDGHPGIFKKVNGKYVPTDYARDLLQFTLFDGAINQDTETAVLYSEMSKGDYIGTSWANFFSDADSTIPSKNIKLGRYFLRIPSDAPKTFILRAPRYAINNENQLFSTGNQDEYDAFINDVTEDITSTNITVPQETLIEVAADNSILITDKKEFVKHILSTGELGIDISDFAEGDEVEKAQFIKRFEESLVKDENGISNILFVYKIKDNNVISYFIKGKYKNGYIYNANLEHTVNVDNNAKNTIKDILSEHFNTPFINQGTITYKDLSVTRKRVVNKEHQLFKQLKNAFKQELIDGIAAARLMFETDVLKDENDNPILVNGKQVYRISRDRKLTPVLKKKWAADLNGLSPIYHFRGKAYENGKLTGRVFDSDKFIIFDENDNIVRNYGQELIDSSLQYLSTTSNPSIDNLILWSENDGTFELELNSKQEAAIDNKIEEYINNFTDVSYNRIQSTKDFMKGREVNIDRVADYMLNHQLIYFASNELLEGDTKYYKDVQTFLKRTKEYQASGNPYGIASIHRTLTSSPLEEMQIGPASWGVTLSDRFNAVTFHTTKKFEKAVLDNLESVLSNKRIMGDHTMSKQDAHVLMYGLDEEGGYTDAKVNDAQSYITFEEWIRRVAARGELAIYTPLINKIMNRETLTKDDLKEFIQVQKNIYYDMYYDSITGRVVPRQIKNAEYVLVPQFIEGTELMEVYKFMKANNIAQINTDETSKASNNYIIDIFDENGNLKQEVIDSNNIDTIKDNSAKKKAKDYKNLVNRAIQPYSYNYLYEQQKVPQHIFANNKFAIQIAKKIIDNIQENHPLYAEKMRYFALITANIRSSFVNLMKEFNIPVDENGNLTSVDATIFKDIDYQKFYDKLKVELGRLGIDDNSFDYATLTGNPYTPGETVMPNYFGIMINKLESIVQSIVTKNITRQTLHGFHAAQITNIGYVKLGEKGKIKKDTGLKYHPAGYYNADTNTYVTVEEYNKLEDKSGYTKAAMPYAEVKLPYSAFGIDKNSKHYKDMTDDEIIEELHKKKLDLFIGYRIPTEGKQSVSVMKIAGFISDGSGSTIVVPNEWVPQTGSDFDVDSVYGIMHKVKINSNGEVKKINYKTDFNRSDWYSYVASAIGGRIEVMTQEEFDAAKKIAKEEGKKASNKVKIALQELEQEAYNNLPGKYFVKDGRAVYIGAKGGIVKIHRLLDEQFGENPSREKYIEQLKNEYSFLTEKLNRKDLTDEEIEAINDYSNIIKRIYDSITDSDSEATTAYTELKNKKLKELEEKAKEEQYKAYASFAKDNDLLSEEEFIEKANNNPIDFNKKDARDNEIVDIMINIMSHPYSLEENLSRSNFDKITGNDNAAVDKLRNPIEQLKRKNRSPFNILDEADSQEDAMQGFALKGFSVARDTFCSICNTVRPTIAETYAPVITYDYSHLNDKDFNKTLKELKDRFNDKNQENVKNNGKLITIRHNKIGWSHNGDRNIDGFYITVYSSQTTAHILDAMKSGPVPNVNKYTFGVYKTLVDIGSRYETAVGFIMHPAIAVINKYYNRTNSIYATDVSTKYIESALEEYCDKLAAIPESKVKFKRRATLSEKLEIVNKVFNTSFSLDYINSAVDPINESDIALRILNEDSYKDKVGGEINMTLADMSHVINFAKLMELTNNISSIQQVTNPDKFGAKQTIFETERVFKQIEDYVKDKYVYDKQGQPTNNSILSVDGKDMLETIYPDFVNVLAKGEDSFDDDLDRFVKSNTNIQASKYPTLCAQLKYSSATSIIVNKAFFVTQTPQFRAFINSIEGYFSDGKRLDNKTYKELRSYIINALYRRASFINNDLKYVKGKGFDFNYGDGKETNYNEYTRIYGYNRNSGFEIPTNYNEETGEVTMSPLVINNVSDPTQEEIDAFAALSPAQKIEYIRNNFRGESIFNYLTTRLSTTIATNNTSAGAQLISFVESSADIDYLRELFSKSFTNKNPLIALTAADIIKYAFVVDGYQFTRNGVSKLIPNSLLLNDGPYAGTNIVSDVNDLMSNIGIYLDDTQLENFIRSHPNLTQIGTRRVQKHGNMYDIARREEDVIFISPSNEELAIQYGILNQSGTAFNSYVRLKFGEDTILYRINPFEDGYAILTPLNALERNENADWSANESNNIYPGVANGYDYFNDLIDRYRKSRALNETGISVTNFEKLMDTANANKFKAISYISQNENTIKEFNIDANTPLGDNIINRATEIINDPDKAYRFLYTLKLDNYIEKDGELIVAVPTKTIVSGKEALAAPHIFRITKVNIASVYPYLKKPSANRSMLTQEEKDILSSLENELKTRGIKSTYSHMFKIEEFKENISDKQVKKIRFSTIGHKPKPIVQATMDVVKGISYMSLATGEEKSATLDRSFKQQRISSKEIVAKDHVEDVIIPAAKVIEDAVENIKDKLIRFKEIPGQPNHYYKITDPEIVKEIKYNLPLREQYLKAILDPAAIESKFAIFRDLDIDSEDESLRPYLKKIKDSVAQLRTIPEVKIAKDNYIDEVLDKLSDNPYIKGKLASVVSGFYKQNQLNALFNDIQESPNALVQVTMKMVQDNLRTSEMQSKIEIELFGNFMQDIRNRAAAAGKSINMDNIVDEYGRFKRNYKEKLIKDRDRLQQAANEKKQHWIEVRDSKPNYELSTESVKAYLDYQKAELEYNEWKAKYIEQEAYNEHNNINNIEDDGYYNTKNKLARGMIDGDGTKYIYAVYQILRDKKNRLMRKQIDDVDNPALDEEIDDIKTKMYNLRQSTIIDPVTHKPIDKNMALPVDDADEMIKRSWNDAVASTLLNEWVENNSVNERKYYKFAPKPQFEQRVRDNLAIVSKYEDRDENNIPRVSQDILANNVEYQKAKRWLRRNASSLFVERGDDSWLFDYSDAMSILHDKPGEISVEYQIIYNNPKYRDENGDLDGIEISKNADLVAKIKKDQEINYKVFREDDFSDRTLLSLAPVDDLVYKDAYWTEMLGAKDPNKDIRQEYKDTITAINNILSPYYSESTNSIDWARMFDSNTEQEVYDRLVALDALYTKLESIAKGSPSTKSKKEIGEWISENCIVVRNDARYADDMLTASMYTGRTAAMFRKIIQGHSKDDTQGNSFLYKTYKLKYDENSEEYKKYVDINKTKARRVVKQYTYRTNTKYYTIARNEALSKGKEFYKDWFFKNHIYNPYERKFEPIAIWRKTEYKTDSNSDIEIEWAPEYSQTTRTIRDGYRTLADIYSGDVSNTSTGGRRKVITDSDFDLTKEYDANYDLRNTNYKEGYGHGENYKYGSNPEYDNPNNQNEFEKEMSDYMQTTISKYVEDKQSIHFIKQGWLPARLKGKPYTVKGALEEAQKLAGFTYYNNGRDEETPIIDYAHDKYIPTPMLGIIKRTEVPNPLKKPIREECVSEEEYLRKKQAWDIEEARVRNEELELRKEYHDKDYEAVIKEFISRASRHNSIQHNKMNLYIAQQLLSEYGIYRQRYGSEGSYKKDGYTSDEEQAEYLRQIDKNMYDQFTTTIRRFVNNEWKAPEGSLTRYMSMLQAMTSAKFMILNFKGGIANVTYGEASIHSESYAREFWNETQSIEGARWYGAGIIDYMAHVYDDTSSTLSGAIVKQFNVVDYDEQRGLTYIADDLAEVSRRLNDFAYSAQSAGEHFLQNRTLFTMLVSHRLFLNPRHEEFGQPKYIYKNFSEYTQDVEEAALKELLSDEEIAEFEKFKADIVADANKFKEYMWFRYDFAGDYVRAKFDWSRQSEYNRLKEDRLKNAEKEFNDDEAHPTIISQLKLGDNGKLAFKDGSLMAEMNTMHNGKVDATATGATDAIKFMAMFKGRVISINKKIHGSYDKSGRAKVENTWWGSVVMQYHKHLPIGFAKRYRSKGYFNEERGAREKGSYVSILDFIKIPVRRHQTLLNLTDDECDAVVGVQNLCKDYLDFVFHIKTAYGTLPEYDKANMRRAWADFHAMFGALFACVALKMAATDDDKNKWWYNFAFYQTDRLASESAQYMPWVIPSEAKKFFGNPVAGFKEVDDMLNTVSALTQMIMGTVGLSDFDPVYDTGVNKGRYKLAVYIERNIPFWRGVRSAFIDINNNNKAYKVGKNVLGFIDSDKLAEKGKDLIK